MSNKKHIDRLFQEKFKDFEVKPDPKIWDNILNEITPKKEKKRVMPLWYKYAGIAALLLVFLTAGIATFKSISNTNGTTKVADTKTPVDNDAIKTKIDKNQSIISNTPVVSYDNSSSTTSNSSSNQSKTSHLNEDNLKATIRNEASVLVTSPKTEKTIIKSKKSTASNSAPKNSTTIANNSSLSKNASSSTSLTYKTKPIATKSSLSKNDTSKSNSFLNGVAVISNSNVQKTANKEEAINNAINAVKEDTFYTKTAQSSNKDRNNDKTIVNDSISTNAIANAVAEANKEPEKEKKKKIESTNKWTVNTNVAPVYYNTLGKGSHIDSEFINNDKTGAINTSYGINVGYAINDKLKIRSGVNSLNLGYDTNNVVIYESVANSVREPNTLQNLAINSISVSGIGTSVISGENINTNQLESFFVEDEFKTTSLKQQINYIEIPVELEYALVNKRFGVNVIGGMSTFVLGDNEVSAEIRGTNTQIGEANNINEISFSTNIGLGMDYDFSKAFKINLEPTFKYQLNAFDDTSGNFNPFILGVYTGLSYKF